MKMISRRKVKKRRNRCNITSAMKSTSPTLAILRSFALKEEWSLKVRASCTHHNRRELISSHFSWQVDPFSVTFDQFLWGFTIRDSSFLHQQDFRSLLQELRQGIRSSWSWWRQDGTIGWKKVGGIGNGIASPSAEHWHPWDYFADPSAGPIDHQALRWRKSQSESCRFRW